MDEKYKDTIVRIKPIAETYIMKHNIQYPIKNSTELLSDMGYYIIKAEAPKNLSGFYMKKDRFPFIFVNTNHSLGRQNFSLWHEVYHDFMDHQNGISDFGSNKLEEREAEIFAGIILLPDQELKKWTKLYDIKKPYIIAQMSVYYQMSFNAVVIRGMQLGEIDFDTFKQLKELSIIENQQQLQSVYEETNLTTSVLKPTHDIKISPNIMSILQNNYENNLISSDKINEIIKKIEVLNDA
ncbi:ImmA/IrrE family metallo-endopeptidase [Staphylococcus saprophyticus]|uniref:ImmA/IrrE family metallo-endopeptidase n=1 Tax=Staphylococcus TaxID=1279 RepID=UPI00034C152F|nr:MULTISPECIES: ImmA/IrrE family metallo-endopeptidase [Staphylococcus]MEB7998527.1 ImmA/IrrE family metallo-endopeptidase [Staphylococcus saprophyticus]